MEEQRSQRRGGPPHPPGARPARRRRWAHGHAHGPGRGPRRTPWLSSLVVAASVPVATAFASSHGEGDERLTPLAWALLLLVPVFLPLRRHRPVLALAGTAVVTLAFLAVGHRYGPVFVPLVITVFTAVVSGRRQAAWWTVGAFWACHALFAHWLHRHLPPAGDRAAPWGHELIAAAWVCAVLAASELARIKKEEWIRQRTERAAAARRRADEERLRIARELHDVLAHSISVINVQAGVGLALLDSDPEQARTALTTIKAASKEALGEVRQVLDGLRTPGDAPRAPAPGLDRLPELVEQAATAGLDVTVATGGASFPLPPGTDLAAFRIVQEALTNVVRHSGSRRARVRIVYGRDRLALHVDDDGPATGSDAGGSGNGLAGMRERAAALGGGIEAGVRPDGGFRVRADLPVRRAALPVQQKETP
ncbi:sensor histidine kinase [Streptomyces amakusaensis]|uniref:histidine kinase n=1 Tax=Streptomyces amakusaensis TaxID=67271 RepID=A0ABW0APJ5_9ACTN